MYVTIDLDSGAAGLAEPDNFEQFHVVIPGGDAAAGLRVLGADGAAAQDADHLWISVAAVRRWAGGSVDSDWEEGFQKMLDFASTSGWLDEKGAHIQAHIESGGR